MRWPRPEFVLYVMGAFLVGYGISVVLRALRGRRWKGTRQACPECGRAWKPEADACTSCGAVPPPARAVNAARWWIAAGLGIFVLGGLVFLAGTGVADWIDAMNSEFTGNRARNRVGPYLGAGFGLSLFGLYVLILGYRGQASKGRRRCPKCWYLIDEALGLKCSECGHEASRQRDLFRPRRRFRLALLGLVLIATGQLGWLESRVRRGGWVAALPTEVLVLGMPWLPDMCLRNGVTGADQDWSLVGRVESRQNNRSRRDEGRMWEWQEDWAKERAAARVSQSRTTYDAHQRLDLLARIDYRPWTGKRTEASAALLHALGISIDALSTPGDRYAVPLAMSAAERVWLASPHNGISEPFPEVSALIVQRTPELLAVMASGPPESRGAAALLLGLGDGRPEVIEALADLAATERHATSAMSWLAARHPAASDRLAAILNDPADTRRAAVTPSTRWLVSTGQAEALEPALLAMLASPDHAQAFRAAEALILSPSDHNRLAVLDRVIEIVRADPTQIDVAEDVFGYLPMNAAVTARADVILELARADQPEIRRLALVILVPQDSGLPPELAQAALELLDAGVPPPAWTSQWGVQALRQKFIPRADP